MEPLNYDSRISPLKAIALCLLFLLLGTGEAVAQASLLCGIIEKRLPDNPAYSDRFGNLYSEEEMSLLGLNIQQNNCDQIEDFELIFEGIDPFTQPEMETICDVFIYLSDLIDAPSGERAIIRLSKASLGNGVGATGTAYFNPECGLGYSIVQQQLFTGGVNVSQHALIQVNSNLSNFYIGPEAGIGANQYDFYTAILHEALHVLGFGSQISQTGAPMQGFYTLWDLNLRNPAGDYLIQSTPAGIGSCCATYEFNDNDFPNMPNGIWNQNCGANNLQFDVVQLPPVNGEYPTQPMDDDWFSQVLSHLDRACGTEHYVMNSGIPLGADGIQRTLTNTEVSILCRLGYETETCEPDCIAIATDDYTFYVELGETINIDISTLLSNDFPSNAVFTYKPDCGNHGGIDITVNPLQITVEGLAIGENKFCYSISVCNGQRCDVGQVIVVVTNPAIGTACDNLDECQINPFWDFELFGSNGEMLQNLTLGASDGMGNGISNSGFIFNSMNGFSDNTPDLWSNPIDVASNRSCGGGPISNINTPFGNQSLGMIVRRFNGAVLPEGASFPLCEPIFPGMSGSVTFYAMTPQSCIGTTDPQIRVEFSQEAPVDHQIVYVTPGISSPSWFVPITTTQNTNPVFGLYTVTFTNETEECWNYLYLSSFTETDNFPPPLPGFGYIIVDNVRVELENNLSKLLDISTEIGPPKPCLGDIVTVQIELCNKVACLPDIYSNPEFLITGILAAGLTHVPNGDFPTLSHQVQASEIPYLGCITLDLTVQVGSNLGLVGQNLGVRLGFQFPPELCYEDLIMNAGGVMPINCISPEFTCPCPPGGINIDASVSSPHYNATLGGVPYSALEAAFNYDQNNDGRITQNEHNDCIAILGNLIFDQNVGISACDNVQMQPCSEITVGTNTLHSTLDMEGNIIYSCDIMWKGIRITPYAALNFEGNTIRDAQFAITAIGESGIGIDPPTRMTSIGNTFANNHVGVLFPGNLFTTVNHLPFTGNVLTSTANLLPPCDAGLFNYSSTLRGFAGVVTQGTPLTVGTPGANGIDNVFSFIRNGVVSSNSVINVQRARFQNIIGIPTPTFPSVANARGNGVAAFGGTANVLNCNFNTVSTGVYGIRNQNLTVRNNTMNFMRLGVETRQVRSSNISDNPNIGFAQTGILHREIIPGGGLNIHRIENNTNMFINPFPGLGPVYSVAIEIDNAMSSDIGTGNITNNHFFSGGNFSDGIRLNGTGEWDIDGNIIDFQAPASAFFSNLGYGIRLTNTNANYLYQNHVNDFDPILRQSTGLSLSDGTGNRYCCNSTFGSRIGSYFFGACGSTEWRVTDMLKHGTALSCAAGTVIDPQFDYGNNFNTTSGTAFHGGDDDQVQQSRFQVLNMQQPHWPEAISTPNTTVQFFDDGGADATCVSPCTAPMFAPPPPDRDIRESDLITASGGWTSGEYGVALQWESARRLFERMQDYEGLLGDQTATDAFYYAAKTGRINDYYNAVHQAKSIYDYPSDIKNALQQSLLQLENNRLAVEAVLTGLASATNYSDSMLIYQNANSLYASAHTAASNLYIAEILAQAFQNAEAMNTLSMTSALPASNLLEQNRKAVQELYLQTLGMGIQHLTAAQFAKAEAIAIQCPLEGGSAVYAARALYRLNADRAFSDDSLCLLTQERKNVFDGQMTGEELILVPNPASDMVTIKGLLFSEDQPVEVCLIDMNGKQCAIQTFESGDVSLSTSNLLEGVYICQIKVRGKSPVALKLIVVH
jgi:hypothetical protein